MVGNFCLWFMIAALGLPAGFSLAADPAKPASGAQAGAMGAVVTKVDGEGNPRLRRKSGIESSLGNGQVVFPGDKILTDGTSAVEIILNDGTLVRVGLNSEYQLQEVKKMGGVLSWVFNLAKGSIRALVEKSADKKTVKFRVNTPSGTMGVRGTELVLDHRLDSGRTTLYTVEGLVDFGAKDCVRKKSCIQVKGGETSSILVNQSKPERAKPFAPEDVLGFAKNGGGEKSSATGAPSAGASPSTIPGAPERLALFEDVKKASSQKNTESAGDLTELMKSASEKMATSQDQLIGRTKETREAMHKAAADGTYNDSMAAAEKYDDSKGSKRTSAEREEENLSADVAAKKFALGKKLLEKDGLGKEKILDKKQIEEKLSKSKSLLADKQAALDGVKAKVEEANRKLEETKKASAELKAAAATQQQQMEIAQVMQFEQSPTPVLDAPGEMVATGTVAETAPDTSAGGYEYQVNEYYQQYYSTYSSSSCRFSFFGKCGGQYTKSGHLTTNVHTRTMQKSSGECYNQEKKCEQVLVPCDLSSGRFCKPSFREQCTYGPKTPVSCPYDHHYHYGHGGDGDGGEAEGGGGDGSD